MTALLKLRGIRRTFQQGDETIVALDGIDLTIEAGEMVAILGQSGSGKSTLMHILGGLDQGFEGHYWVAGQDVKSLSEPALTALRSRTFGFVFQRYFLLPYLNVLGNVVMPMRYAGMTLKAAQQRAMSLLQQLGLERFAKAKPAQLSGGQQQRVAIARALANRAPVILADEPTGALDQANSGRLMKLLGDLHAQGQTIILITHSAEVAACASRQIELSNGHVVSDTKTPANAQAQVADINNSSQVLQENSVKQSPWGIDRLSEALTAVFSRPLRTFLSVLGIAIGIAAFVTTAAVGEGAQKKLQEQLSQNNRMMQLKLFSFADSLDQRVFGGVSLMPGKEFSAGEIQTLQQFAGLDRVVPCRSISSRAKRDKNSTDLDVLACQGGLPSASGWPLSTNAMAALEHNHANNTAVLNNFAASRLGITQTPASIYIGDLPFVVPHVVDDGQSSARAWVSQSYALRRITAVNQPNLLYLFIAPAQDFLQVLEEVKQWVRQVRSPTTVFITSPVDQWLSLTEANRTVQQALIVIALICLVVGGIGVTNIIFMSVRERYQEIGIRMAVGATRTHIALQFLLEAIMVCVAGGVLGLLCAALLQVAFVWAGAPWLTALSPAIVVGAVGFSMLCGILAGALPARAASRQNVISVLTQSD